MNSLVVEDVSECGHWVNGEQKFKIEKIEDLEAGLDYIKQSYNYTL